MKKILSFILGVVLSFQFLSFSNIIFAAQEVKPEGNSDSIGMTLEGDCINGMGSKCFKYEDLLGVGSEGTRNKSTFEWIQDAIFAAVYFVGTVLVIVLLYCGFQYIIASGDVGQASNLQKYMKNAAIGAVLVRGAYAIVRIVQYIAKG